MPSSNFVGARQHTRLDFVIDEANRDARGGLDIEARLRFRQQHRLAPDVLARPFLQMLVRQTQKGVFECARHIRSLLAPRLSALAPRPGVAQKHRGHQNLPRHARGFRVVRCFCRTVGRHRDREVRPAHDQRLVGFLDRQRDRRQILGGSAHESLVGKRDEPDFIEGEQHRS
jgi:hypothetical protein